MAKLIHYEAATMKDKLKRLPIFGPLGAAIVRIVRATSRKIRHARPAFRRINPGAGPDRAVWQIFNLLEYTKTSASSYSGEAFPAGYHTLEIGSLHLVGQRNPSERLSLVPFDFAGKTVLDLGCNEGGMLFALADKIAHGVGIDYDYRVINAANRICSYMGAPNLEFYVLDFDRDRLDLVKDFIPRERVDIAFLLAVCMWIKNWRRVIDLAADVADAVLFESNGSEQQQQEQIVYLRSRFKSVELLSHKSFDDKSQEARQLYLCISRSRLD